MHTDRRGTARHAEAPRFRARRSGRAGRRAGRQARVKDIKNGSTRGGEGRGRSSLWAHLLAGFP
jgi:hypothetical protein